MLTDIQTTIVTIAAILGALVSAVLGWLDSGESFKSQKFMKSVLGAFIAGVLFAASTYSGLDTISSGWVYIFAFLGGAGVDVLGNRASGTIVSAVKTASTNPPGSPASSPPSRTQILKRTFNILALDFKKRLMFLQYRK